MKSVLDYLCDRCVTPTDGILNAYGVLLCEECWDEYINTPEGKVEYLIGIAKADYPASAFDADFLGFALVQWHKNRSQFDMSDEEIEEIENKLRCLKIF